MVAVKPAGHGNRPGYGREAAGHEVAFRPVGPHRLNELACTIRQTRLVKGLFDQACRQPAEKGDTFVEGGFEIQFTPHGARRDRQNGRGQSGNLRHVVK